MSDAGELRLRVEGALLGSVVEVVTGERQQLVEELIVLTSVAGRVAGLEQEREARGDAPRLDCIGDLVGALCGYRRVGEPDPRGVVEQERRHGRAHPERRTSSAAARSAGMARRRI